MTRRGDDQEGDDQEGDDQEGNMAHLLLLMVLKYL